MFVVSINQPLHSPDKFIMIVYSSDLPSGSVSREDHRHVLPNFILAKSSTVPGDQNLNTTGLWLFLYISTIIARIIPVLSSYNHSKFTQFLKNLLCLGTYLKFHYKQSPCMHRLTNHNQNIRNILLCSDHTKKILG